MPHVIYFDPTDASTFGEPWFLIYQYYLLFSSKSARPEDLEGKTPEEIFWLPYKHDSFDPSFAQFLIEKDGPFGKMSEFLSMMSVVIFDPVLDDASHRRSSSGSYPSDPPPTLSNLIYPLPAYFVARERSPTLTHENFIPDFSLGEFTTLAKDLFTYYYLWRGFSETRCSKNTQETDENLDVEPKRHAPERS